MLQYQYYLTYTILIKTVFHESYVHTGYHQASEPVSYWSTMHIRQSSFCFKKHLTSLLQICGRETVDALTQIITKLWAACRSIQEATWFSSAEVATGGSQG